MEAASKEGYLKPNSSAGSSVAIFILYPNFYHKITFDLDLIDSINQSYIKKNMLKNILLRDSYFKHFYGEHEFDL